MKKLLTFVAVCYSISFLSAGIFYVCGGQFKSLGGTAFSSAYMLLPLLSVVLTQLIFKEKPFSDTGISFRLNKWWLFAWLIMPVFSIIALFASALLPGVTIAGDSALINKSLANINGMIGPWGLFAISIASGLLAGASVNAVFGFGEEVAWRGFLPRVLGDCGFWKKSLIIGTIWGVWHFPIILMGLNYPSHPVLGVFMMIACCLALTPILLFIRERSLSVIPAAIAHGTLNATAGLSLAYLAGYNDLLCGCCGLVGLGILVLIDIALFIFKK